MTTSKEPDANWREAALILAIMVLDEIHNKERSGGDRRKVWRPSKDLEKAVENVIRMGKDVIVVGGRE